MLQDLSPFPICGITRKMHFLLVAVALCLAIDKSKHKGSKHSTISNETNRCQFWICETIIKNGYFLCYEHHGEYNAGQLDKCPNCGQYKRKKYDLCLTCKSETSDTTISTHDSFGAHNIAYQLEHSEAWKKKDSYAENFYAYILQLDNSKFYAGHTRDLRARLSEHKDGKTTSTAGQDIKLKYYERFDNRGSARQREIELKRLIDHDERQVRKIIIDFHDLHAQIE
ncbi:GIY-YIG nuclease family protein [Chloroflexota bacterium]